MIAEMPRYCLLATLRNIRHVYHGCRLRLDDYDATRLLTFTLFAIAAFRRMLERYVISSVEFHISGAHAAFFTRFSTLRHACA